MIKITVYWNKIIDDPSQPFGTRVLPEYEIKKQYTMDSDFYELKNRWNNHPRMKIEGEKITEQLPKQYGIGSYIEIIPI